MPSPPPSPPQSLAMPPPGAEEGPPPLPLLLPGPAPRIGELDRSASTPEGMPFLRSRSKHPDLKKKRSSSLQALRFQPYDAMTSKEIQGLVQELAYHTDLSSKQLQELLERIDTGGNEAASQQVQPALLVGAQRSPALGPEDRRPSLPPALLLPTCALAESSDATSSMDEQQGGACSSTAGAADTVPGVLAEFGLPTEPAALRVALSMLLTDIDPIGGAAASAAAGVGTPADGGRSSRGGRSSACSSRPSSPRSPAPSSSRHVGRVRTMPPLSAAMRSVTAPVPSPSHLSQVGDLHTRLQRRRTSGFQTRMAVRLQISRFLHEPQKRVKIVTLWRHEASYLPAVQQAGGCLTVSRHADQWFKRLYAAFETSLSNLLDENDSPIREVVIDFVLREAKRASVAAASNAARFAATVKSPEEVEASRTPSPEAEVGSTKSLPSFGGGAGATTRSSPRRGSTGGGGDEAVPRPAQIEGLRRVVLGFAEAVLSVRSSTGSDDGYEQSQWADCLSGVASQFEQALDDAWRSLWPGTRPSAAGGGRDGAGEGVSPMESLRSTLAWNSENASLLFAATRGIAATAVGRSKESERDPQRFWGAYLRQAIKVSKSFLQLVREMTLMVGLWTSGYGQAGEHLSDTVLRKEYRRVRHAFADMLTRRSREIHDAWSTRLLKEVPIYGKFLQVHRHRHFCQRILSASIEWWRTGQSGVLRAVCMDIVMLFWSTHGNNRKATDNDDDAVDDIDLEDLEGTVPIFEEVIIEALDREIVIHAQAALPAELGAVDVPRCKDILSRLMTEILKHFDSEWHIAQEAQSSSGGLLPAPEFFQAPHWTPPTTFDFGAPKTAFLGSEVGGRYNVARYVNRGAMGRVWVVEDRLGLEDKETPLCLKTFYCECECEEMSNLTTREFKRCVLEELSQVERWLTSRTRLATSEHIVRVVRVFRDVPVIRGKGDTRIDGTLSGILMEFCDKGELTSYLWDPKRHEPRAFDEPSALFLFRQLVDLLAELLAPQALPASSATAQALQRFRVSSCCDLNNGGSEGLGAGSPSFGALPNGEEVVGGSVTPPTHTLGLSAPAFQADLKRTTSTVSEVSAKGSNCSEFDQDDRPAHLKYFHNDIKTENLVISAATLKLIDFQSLAPLFPGRGVTAGLPHRAQVEHATPVYQHRQPGAVGRSLEEGAEATCIWAAGVILTRLLASQLSTDWVFRHGGLGNQEELEEVLPDGHCLLVTDDPHGPRDLLERIFSPNRTPTVPEVLAHSWVAGSRQTDSEGRPCAELRLAERAEQSLKERRPEGLDPGNPSVAWIPLAGHVNVEGMPPPLKAVDEIINVALSLSDGRFRLSGVRQRVLRRGGAAGAVVDGTAAAVAAGESTPGGRPNVEEKEEMLHEWHVIVSADDDDDEENCMAPEEELPVSPVSKEPTPTTTPHIGPQRVMTPVNLGSSPSGASPMQMGGQRGGQAMGPSPSASRRRPSMWQALRTRLVVDRFYVQVRIKEDLDEDESAGIWWLRVKWVPPLVTGKKDTLGSFTSAHHHHHHGKYSTCSFVHLQQLLLEGRNEVTSRLERERAVAARRKSPGTLQLPIFGRA